ncbi:DUF4350 domain-containing protein [Pseudonocardia humida]|uniref:DUF4350 domain-containing protein n=1 Tax=Pseudonocardia humida TaxID=2800819 RepID=A0ABT0ZXZ6_9PSEU|nr:DUF4350 domain-containing protein [Pseudonocardia humida]MCO1655586.1 DUF4350 domain-containing protein [Pseudonocardia humida]
MTAPGTAGVRDLGAAWRAARAPVAIGAVVLAVAVLIALLTDRAPASHLDPAAPEEEGSRAVAVLLGERGVAVHEVGRAAEVPAGAGATVLVPFPERLSPTQLDAVRTSAADVVLVAPEAEVLAALAPGIELVAREEPVEVREPVCALPAAVRAGAVSLGGYHFRAGPDAGRATTCYATDHGSPLVQVERDGRTVTALGSADVLLNRALAEEGNAALALSLLGEHPRLAWFRPVPEGPPPGADRSVLELVPAGWWWGAAQLAIAVALLAAWRARRLGPVVTEPLPVVVRSAEAAEGRARLYRRAGDRGHAAEVLRGAARARLVALLGLPDDAEPAAVVRAVAGRSDHSITEVSHLLYGPAPVDDAGLVALAETLDRYEAEVRRS